MGRTFGQMAALAAALLLAACQSPELAVSALPDNTMPLNHSAGSGAMEASTTMPLGAETEAPSGYLDFCKRQPAECADPANAPDLVTLNAAIWSTLEQVNATYNAAIRPQEDAAHYGRVDYWTIPTDG